MAQPTPYDRQFNFQNQQAQTPSAPVPADEIDAEFNAVKITLDQVLGNLELIQRDDGEVANETIGEDQLKPELTLLGSSLATITAAAESAEADAATAVAAKDDAETAATTTEAAQALAETAKRDAQAARDDAQTAQANAEAAETAAAASAASVVETLEGTSTSSVAIGTGAKAFTTQSDKSFDPGAWLIITSDAAPDTNYMHGVVTAYSGTDLTVDVSTIGGSGTYADWTIRVSGVAGGSSTAAAMFQCRLAKNGSNLELTRHSGEYLFINGANESIPSGGVTLAPTSLSVDTSYYIYAYMNTGTMTLEASATAPATDSTYGHKIKTGDATRTLVGFARTITGPAWADTALQRFVLSYYNRRNIYGTSTDIDTSSTTSGSAVAINSTNLLEFLTWGDEAVQQSASAIMNNSTTNGMAFTIGLDGSADATKRTQLFGGNASMQAPMSTVGLFSPSEGYHYAQGFMNSVVGGDTTTCFVFNTQVMVRG